ncbi:MAG: hypothetical protein HOP10_13385 [Chitinophagaceae bacterium]|nr:hypothetical protein [Chitinophagaceae bacterium]
MQRRIRKHLNALVILSLVSQMGYAQAKGGVENYNFLSQGEDHIWMPVLHYEAKKGMYAELRYNYEDVKTFSVFGGKIFSGKDNSLSVTPMIGFSIGQFTGVSVAANVSAERNNFFLSSETQYSIGAKKSSGNFLFNWSEIGYSISPNLFAGLSFQYTLQDGAGDPDPGLMAGISLKNFSIPVYVFNPFKKDQYFVLGLNYEYQLKKRK